MDNHNFLVMAWKYAAKDLGLVLIAPYTLSLSSGLEVEAPLLLRNFGNIEGMLIFDSFDLHQAMREINQEIMELGYSMSYMEYPSKEPYDRLLYIEILRDWGWTGKDSEKPRWY